MLSFLQTLSHKYKAAVPQILGCVGTPARQMTAANGGSFLNLGFILAALWDEFVEHKRHG